MAWAEILDDENTVAPGNGGDRVHVGADARIVHDVDGARAVRYGRFDARLVDVQRVGPDVDKNRRAAAHDHGIGGRNERERRHDDLVARTDVAQHRRQFERRSARGCQQRVRRGKPLREPCLAPARVWTVGGQMARRQGFSYEIEFAADNGSAIERDES